MEDKQLFPLYKAEGFNSTSLAGVETARQISLATNAISTNPLLENDISLNTFTGYTPTALRQIHVSGQ